MKRKLIYLRKSFQKGKFCQSASQVQHSEFENVLVFAEIGSHHALGVLSYFKNPGLQYLVSIYRTDEMLGFWANGKGRSLDFSTQAQSLPKLGAGF